MRASRALMYTPGDDLHKIKKATPLHVDRICMDMEDGVAINRKAESRQTIVTALETLDFGRSERMVRINAVGSELEAADLAAVFSAGAHIRPDSIVVPKVESPDQVIWVSQQIAQAERRWGWPVGGIGLVILVESALGIVRLGQILSADERLQAVVFGSEDLAGDIGAVRTPEAWEVFYARSAIVTHAAAFNLQAIDMVYVDFRDLAGLQAEALQGARLGYSGKQIIHPNQVGPVQAAFSPSPEALAHARRVQAAFEAHQSQGRGAFALDGKMVDMPMLKAAQRVLERAQAAADQTNHPQEG